MVDSRASAILASRDNYSAQESTYQQEAEGHIVVRAPEISSKISDLQVGIADNVLESKDFR